MIKKGIVLLASVLFVGMTASSGNPCVSYAQSVDNDGYDIVEERDTSECDDDGTSTAGTSGESGTGQGGQGVTGPDAQPTEASPSGSAATGSSETASSAEGPMAYAGQTGSYGTHVLDNTPKTADLHIEPVFVFSGGLFFAGLAMILLDKKRN